MKLSFFNMLVCASLMVVSISCGKDGGGGGGKKSSTPNPYGQMQPVIDPNMSSPAQIAFNNLKAWYATPDNTSLQFRGTYVRTVKNVNNISFEGQISLCFLGMGYNCNPQAPQPTHCFRKNNSTSEYDMGTATGYGMNDCSISNVNVTKATNPSLAEALNGNGFILINVIQTGNVFLVDYVNNSFTAKVRYTIDTSIHSILNPVQVQTLTNSSNQLMTKEYLRTFQF